MLDELILLTRKLIIFLVEGITEEISFGMIFSEILKDKEIEFAIIHGDITTKKEVNYQNIKGKVKQQIKSFLSNEHYKKSDILKIVHIIDTDGVYIEDRWVNKYNGNNILYHDDKILSSSPDMIVKRNNKKSRILNILTSTNKIFGINYHIYYLSCNLEHVLHNEANIESENKIIKAEEFEENYFDREHEFLDFIRSEDIAVQGNFQETWKYIKNDLNSLKRNSNLHLVFNDY